MDLYLLSEREAIAAGTVIAAAFHPSPPATFVFPDPARRALVLPHIFAAMTRLAIQHGEATAIGTPPQAVALWLAPGFEELPETAYMAAGMGDAEALMEEGEAARLAALNDHCAAAHARVMEQPHWYLPFLGVDPESQGTGLGSTVIRYTLDRVVASGVPSYLDSADERNLPFYARLGFRVAETGLVPGSQLRTWSLRRD